MGDSEMTLSSFELECKVDVSFDASDIVRSMKPSAIVKLIQELDDEVSDWTFTVALTRTFSERVKAAPPEELEQSDDQLALNVLAMDDEFYAPRES